jgi:hypothetical protein
MTTDRDSIDDYLISRVSPWRDSNIEARRINMIGRSNREAVNSTSKYLVINRAEHAGQIRAPIPELVHVE